MIGGACCVSVIILTSSCAGDIILWSTSLILTKPGDLLDGIVVPRKSLSSAFPAVEGLVL